MEIELLMRVEGAFPQEHADEIQQAQIVKGEDFNLEEYLSKNNLFVYRPVTFNVFSATPYNKHDDNHTHIYLDTGLSFIAKIKYEIFQRIKSAMTNTNVKTLSDFKLKE